VHYEITKKIEEDMRTIIPPLTVNKEDMITIPSKKEDTQRMENILPHHTYTIISYTPFEFIVSKTIRCF
jgi:hypothetical protein